jgi:alkanesulfonate monooxygenase
VTGPDARTTVELAWFGALCDDDYRQLGVAEPSLRSSWDHCRDITLAADRAGFDNILLPSGFSLGIDSVAFAAAVAPQVERMQLLVAVRTGEMWPPQLARQLATVDHMLGSRLTINIISSDLPGESLPSGPRYQRTLEVMTILRTLLDGQPLEHHGEFYDLVLDPPRIATEAAGCPALYFGGFSDDAKETAAAAADVFLTWPDTVEAVAATIADMRQRADRHGRTLRYGLRTHVVVRETEDEARAAARHLVAALDPGTGDRIRARSLDATSAGVSRQAELRDAADDDGYVGRHLWTGIGRARSGAGAAIVGDAEQVCGVLDDYRRAGVDAFILSGYPHLDECRQAERHLLPRVAHGPLLPRH